MNAVVAEAFAPDQCEGALPEDLAACDPIAAGGIAGRLLGAHKRMRTPTHLRPLGLLADAQGERLNLRRYALMSIEALARRPPVMVVVGTAMHAGKTTAASYLIRRLTSAGLRVGAAKLTGTRGSASLRRSPKTAPLPYRGGRRPHHYPIRRR